MHLVLLVLLLAAAVVVAIPVGILRRYRVSTKPRRARRWVATVNLVGLLISSTLLVLSAAITTVWVGDALEYTVFGLLLGLALGAVGVWLARWERNDGALYYTHNRVLILAITLVVAGRLLYGLWRASESARRGLSGDVSLVDAGIAGSLGAGALVLGYYIAFWIAVRKRVVERQA